MGGRGTERRTQFIFPNHMVKKQLMVFFQALIRDGRNSLSFHFSLTVSLKVLCQSPKDKILNFTDTPMHTHVPLQLILGFGLRYPYSMF